MNKPKYVVVQEWIHHAQLFQLKDHSSEMTQHSVMDNDDYENNYWAIVEVDEDGWYYDTVEDNFNSAKEAWDRYDELTKGE